MGEQWTEHTELVKDGGERVVLDISMTMWGPKMEKSRFPDDG